MGEYKLTVNYCTHFIKKIGSCNWNWCCWNHDNCYGASGIKRWVCDMVFEDCINNRGCFWARVLAHPMYLAVRELGGKYYKKRQLVEKLKRVRKFRKESNAKNNRRKQQH